MLKGEGTAMYKGTETRGYGIFRELQIHTGIAKNGLSFNGNDKQRC